MWCATAKFDTRGALCSAPQLKNSNNVIAVAHHTCATDPKNGAPRLGLFLVVLLAPHKMSYVLEAALGDKPANDAPQDVRNVYQTKADDSSLVQSGMLYAMEAELQKRFENMSAYKMITDLKAVFAPQARAERYEASEFFFSAKMEEHSSVC